MTAAERREMRRLRRQRDALLDMLQAMTTEARLSLFPGAEFGEVFRLTVLKSERVLKRTRDAISKTEGSTP